MKAIVVDENRNLTWEDFEEPLPGPGEVRISVRATAINRADLMQRRGHYPPPPGASPIMGLECAGTIDHVGEGVDRWRPGDEVCALLAGGGYAEYAVAPAGSVVPIPASLDMSEAASLPEVYATVWLNLFMEAGLRSGEKVVLHAGGSGVGTAGIQLCRAFGNPSFVTAGSEGKIRGCVELGAAGGGNRHADDFFEACREFAEPEGVGVILDPVGGAYLKDNLELLGTDGRLVLIGLMGGGNTEIALPVVLAKRLKVIGSTLRNRSDEAKAEVMRQLEENVWPRFANGEIRPVIDASFPISEAATAHDHVAANGTFGKVVMTID